MPKVVYTASKGLVQETGSGFESEVLPKVVQEFGSSVTLLTFDAVNAAGADYEGGKYFVLHGQKNKYQLYFSSIGGTAQDVPAALPNHTLVSIGNLAATANATAVGAAVVAAVGGLTTGISELTSVNNAGAVTVASILPQKASGTDHIGNLTTTEITGLTIADSGAGLATPSLNLVRGSVNVIKIPDFTATHTPINQDGSGTPDRANYVLQDGEYVGQEVTIILSPAATNAATGAVEITIGKLRDKDGGGISSKDMTNQPNHDYADGHGMMKCIWDGQSWIQLLETAVTEFGYTLA